MTLPRFVAAILSISVTIPGTALVSAQSYPTKPIRIVTGAVGGTSDFGARLIATGIAGPLGQAIIVDNRGGNARIAAEAVAKAAPDGYTLLYYTSAFWLEPYLIDNAGYDPLKDFAPITLAVSTPAVLAVHPSVPAKSIADLIALAKAKPGALNYSSAGPGTTPHLAAELFKAMTHVNIVRVAYKGAAPAIIDLVAGQTHMIFVAPGLVAPNIKLGRLKALGVSSVEPSALAPGLPTLASTGLPGYEYETLSGIFSTGKTPAAVVNRLNQEIVRYIKMPETKERLLNLGLEAVGNTPEQFAAAVRSDMDRLGSVIRNAGIRAE